MSFTRKYSKRRVGFVSVNEDNKKNAIFNRLILAILKHLSQP